MDVAISKVFTIVYKYVDSVYIFPKFRKQFIQVLLLGVLDMVKDVSQPSLFIPAFHFACAKE